MKNEEWRPAIGFERFYEVSNHGRIRRIGQGRGARVGHILKDWPHRNGYRMVTLSVDGQRTALTVHRLVAMAFLGPSFPDSQVNHINGNKADNRSVNLEWVTATENAIHASETLGVRPKGEQCPWAKLTAAEVRAIRQSYATGHFTQAALGERYGVAFQTISAIVRHESWRHVQ
jgi:hypothetical protein